MIMELSGTDILVIGAGIGGLAVAQILSARGANVTVVEQARQFKEVGTGLQISPNGFAVLKALQLDEALKERSVEAEAIHLRDYRGRKVLSLDLKRHNRRNYHLTHRSDIIEALVCGANSANVEIRLAHRVENVVSGEKPHVRLGDGKTIEADLVVGADGIHSVARSCIMGTLAPYFTNQTAWRAVVPNDAENLSEVVVYMGPHRHVVTYPVRNGQLRNIVAVMESKSWTGDSYTQKDDPDAVQGAFSDFCPHVRELMRQIQEVHLWGLFRYPIAPVWHKRGVAILGDAAHPTLPFLAQGASMALEDAWVLGSAIDAADDLDAGLARFHMLRRNRVRRVVDSASGNAGKYHLAFPPFRWIAHSILRACGAIAPRRILESYDWLFNHDVTSEH